MTRTEAFDLLIPMPKRIRQTTGGVPARTLSSAARVFHESGFAPGAYRLELTPSGVSIAAGDEAGARHAEATLAQIRNLREESLPCVVIEDEPALARRGVMLDISRSRVPRMSEFARLAGSFAALKLDHLQCYTEHAFAYREHEAIWAGNDPITPQQARSLVAVMRRSGIELAANQNCFGHLTRFLRHPAYAPLAETHGDWIFAGMPRSGPFSLCPTDPRSLSFVEGLLDEMLPCFSSPLVNIGCDETYDIGQGRSKSTVETQGKASVYGRFVAEVCRLVADRGKTPMFWADIASEHPEALDRIPPEAHALVWGYEPSHDFMREASLHRAASRPWWICPGTSSWRSFTGRSRERHENIRRAASVGVSQHAHGMLIADWGDIGHRQVWPIALLGIAEGADAAWTGNARARRFLEAVSLQVFGDASLRTAGFIEELGDADEPLRAVSGVPADDGTHRPLANASALFTELHPPPLPLGLPKDTGPWESCRDRLADLAQRVPTGAGELVERELRHACACAIWACDVALRRRGATCAERTPESLAAELSLLKAEHAALWTQRSRRGGLAESLAFWDEIPLCAPTEGSV